MAEGRNHETRQTLRKLSKRAKHDSQTGTRQDKAHANIKRETNNRLSKVDRKHIKPL